jgi:hypothetical protein
MHAVPAGALAEIEHAVAVRVCQAFGLGTSSVGCDDCGSTQAGFHRHGSGCARRGSSGLTAVTRAPAAVR